MISDFITQVKTRGLARTNRFSVELVFPTGGSDGDRLANLFCESVNIPGITISTTPQRINGEVTEFPYERMFDPAQLVFYVDAQMLLKKQFDEWLGLIVSPTSRNISYYRDYVRDITISVHTVDEQTPYKIQLIEAYPKTVGSVQLDSNGKEVMRLSVTLAYKYFKIPLESVDKLPLEQPQDPINVITGEGYPDFTFTEFTPEI